MEAHAQGGMRMQKAGGIAALYIAVAYLAAIPYFVVLVNYPGVVDPVQKVILLRDNYLSMYLMHLFSFEFVALALIVVTLAIYQRLKERAPSTAQVATVVGLIWAGLLLASVMVFNYGMGAVVRLYATDPSSGCVGMAGHRARGGSPGRIRRRDPRRSMVSALERSGASHEGVPSRSELAGCGNRHRRHPFVGAGFERTWKPCSGFFRSCGSSGSGSSCFGPNRTPWPRTGAYRGAVHQKGAGR